MATSACRDVALTASSGSSFVPPPSRRHRSFVSPTDLSACRFVPPPSRRHRSFVSPTDLSACRFVPPPSRRHCRYISQASLSVCLILALSIVLVFCTAHGAEADQSPADTKLLNHPGNEVGDFGVVPEDSRRHIPNDEAESVRTAVERLLEAQKYDSATQLLTKALANDPNDKELRAVVLVAIEELVGHQQYTFALELLNRAVTNDTNGIYKEALSSVHYRYADYLKSQHDKDGAKREHELGSQLEKELHKDEKRQKQLDEHS